MVFYGAFDFIGTRHCCKALHNNESVSKKNELLRKFFIDLVAKY